MDTLFLIIGMFLVTFSVRYVLLPLSGRVMLSSGLRHALRYVPPVVLTAIIVPAVLLPDGRTFQLSWHNAYLVGAVITVIVGKISKNMLVTIIGGMVFFVLWQWLVQAVSG